MRIQDFILSSLSSEELRRIVGTRIDGAENAIAWTGSFADQVYSTLKFIAQTNRGDDLIAAIWAERPIFELKIGRLRDQWLAELEYRNVEKPYVDASPYRGLLPFEESQRHLYFGRKNLIGEALKRMSRTRCITPTGDSGCGKSSFVMAGLVPALHDSAPGTVVVRCVPGQHPALDTYREMVARGLRPPECDETDSASQILARLEAFIHRYTEHPLVLFFDQFERVFGGNITASERRAICEFLANLRAQAHRLPHTTLIVALRGDAIADALNHKAIHAGDVLHFPPMTNAELTAAIVRPAAEHGVVVEPALCDDLLADLGADNHAGGRLPLLQLQLHDLWQRKTERRITSDSYRKQGGISAVIQNQINEVIKVLSRPQSAQNVERQILDVMVRLIDVSEENRVTGRRVARSEFPGQTHRLLAVLCTNGLLVESGDTPAYEFSHEAVIRAWPPLSSLVEARREAIRMRLYIETEANDWEAEKRNPSELLRGRRLKRAAGLQRTGLFAGEGFALSERATTYLRESELVELRGKARRSRRAWFFSAALGLTSVVAVVQATEKETQRAAADKEREEAERMRAQAQDHKLRAIDAIAEIFHVIDTDLKNLDSSGRIRSGLLKHSASSLMAFGEPNAGADFPLIRMWGLQARLQADIETESGQYDDSTIEALDAAKAAALMTMMKSPSWQHLDEFATVLDRLGLVYSTSAKRDLARAQEEWTTSIDIRDRAAELNESRLFGESPATLARAERDKVITMNRLGQLHLAQGRLDLARSRFDSAYEITKAHEGDPDWSQVHSDTAIYIAQANVQNGHVKEAMPYYDEGIQFSQKVLQRAPMDLTAHYRHTAYHAEKAGALFALKGCGARKEVHTTLEASIEKMTYLLEFVPDRTDWRFSRFHARSMMGDLQWCSKDKSGMKKLYGQAGADLGYLLKRSRTLDLVMAQADLGTKIARMHLDHGDVDLATRALDPSLRTFTELTQGIQMSADIDATLGSLLAVALEIAVIQGDGVRGRDLFTQLESIAPRLSGPNRATTDCNLAEAALALHGASARTTAAVSRCKAHEQDPLFASVFALANAHLAGDHEETAKQLAAVRELAAIPRQRTNWRFDGLRHALEVIEGPKGPLSRMFLALQTLETNPASPRLRSQFIRSLGPLYPA